MSRHEIVSPLPGVFYRHPDPGSPPFANEGDTVDAGQTIGLLDGVLVSAADEQTAVIGALLEQMELDTREIVTVYYGQSVGLSQAEALAEQIQAHYPDVEVEVQHGGQPLYDYILSAE